MHVLAFVNQKGGCGKTTTAVQLAAGLARESRRVLLVDLDPQAHATLSLGVHVGEDPSLIEVLGDELAIEAARVRVPGDFDLLPATLELAEFEEVSQRMIYPERVLAAALDEVIDDYDYVLLDCPPRADGVLTANALRAADTALLVVECGAFALQGALMAKDLLAEIAESTGHAPRVRVVATLFDRRTRFSRELLIGMQSRLGVHMYDSAIRTSVRLREAAAYGVPVQELDPRCHAAADFEHLAREVIADVESDESVVQPIRARRPAVMPHADSPSAVSPKGGPTWTL